MHNNKPGKKTFLQNSNPQARLQTKDAQIKKDSLEEKSRPKKSSVSFSSLDEKITDSPANRHAKKSDDGIFLRNRVFLQDNFIKTAIENIRQNSRDTRETAGRQAHSWQILHYRAIKDDFGKNHGGYGSNSIEYAEDAGSYVDYGKIFGYLGKYKSSAYENFHSDIAGSFEVTGFSQISEEALSRGAKHEKYLSPPGFDMYGSVTSMVGPQGMNSKDWEKFKIMMMMDKVMYMFKRTIS